MTEQQKEIAKQWVAALRSGEYEQGKSYLQADGKYCCLGVLCDLYQKSHPDSPMITDSTCGQPSPYDPGDTVTATAYDGCNALLPDVVSGWVGLWSPTGKVRESDGDAVSAYSLVGMNDHGHSFEVIANEIEADLNRSVPSLFL